MGGESEADFVVEGVGEVLDFFEGDHVGRSCFGAGGVVEGDGKVVGLLLFVHQKNNDL